jgi:glycosyltransferase involved in cell wall biosynthesis
MGPQDGLDLALRALAHLVLARGRDDVRAVFIGDGEQRVPAERLVDQLGIRANVEFTGWLGENDVFHHLLTADVGLEPNMERVVSPVKVMEYTTR